MIPHRRSWAVVALVAAMLAITPLTALGLVTHRNGSGAAVAVPSVGAGSPYPSTVHIAGLEGVTDRVTVSLTLTHTRPDDLDILLVSPTGKAVVIMSDVGGAFPISHVQIVLADGSAAMPDNAALTHNQFAPTNFGAGDAFPAPAPGGTPSATLGAFRGANPNGTWKLFVVDDAAGESGSVEAWSITVTTRLSFTGGPITIHTVGKGTPYPGMISIPHLVGTVSRVEVTLTGLTHSHPEDLDILLTDSGAFGSSGAGKVRLMSDVGGGHAITNVNLHFLDSAVDSLPNLGQITSGSYKPTNRGLGDDNFPAPAPAAPYADTLAMIPAPADGTWKLYINDDGNGDGGSLASWTLTIVTSDAPPDLHAIATQVLKENQVTNVNETATDFDAVTLTAEGLPSFVTFHDHGDGTGNIVIAPKSGDLGSYRNLTIFASDGDLTSQTSFDIGVRDGTGPVTTATRVPAANAAGWNKTDVSVHLVATDLNPVTSITYQATGHQSIPLTVVPGDTADTPAITAESSTTVVFHALDNQGNVAREDSIVVKVDKIKPTIGQGPGVSLATGQQLDTAGRVPMTVSGWSFLDQAGSGIDHFTLQQKVNGGAFQAVTLPSALATSVDVLGAPGSTYVFQALATDVAGNTSDAAVGATLRPRLRQETDAAIVDTGTWTTEAAASASGGGTQWADAAGEKATFTFTGRKIGWVASKGPDRGIATVFVDGVQKATVDLFAASPDPRLMAFDLDLATDAQHTIEVRATGTRNAASSGTRVDIDAFVFVEKL